MQCRIGGETYQSPGPLSLLLLGISPLLPAAAEAKLDVKGVGILRYCIACSGTSIVVVGVQVKILQRR